MNLRRLLLPLILPAVIALGCRDEQPPPAPPPVPAFTAPEGPPPSGTGLLLIVVDTMRHDIPGRRVANRSLTPNIDRLAAGSTQFSSYYAAAPWTAPAFGTMFTGVSPSRHEGGLIAPRENPTAGRMVKGFYLKSIRSDMPTLAEHMKQQGMTTGAVVSNPFLFPLLGYRRGFDEFDYSIAHRRADEVTERAIRWLNANGDKPFFYLVHYIDLHTPYDPLPAHRDIFDRPAGRMQRPFMMPFDEVMRTDFTNEERSFIRSLYDGEMAQVDRQIGRLLAALQRNGMADRTSVGLTYDYGEEFLEHGGLYHGRQYEDEVTRIPLMIRAPGGTWGAGNTIPATVCQVDLLPTLVALAGAPPKDVEGRSLLPLLTGASDAGGRCYMEAPMMRHHPDPRLSRHLHRHAFFDGRYKVIRSDDGTIYRAFDLLRDPGEKVRLPAMYPAVRKATAAMNRYRAMLRRTGPSTPSVDAVPLPADVQQSLEALGYTQ